MTYDHPEYLRFIEVIRERPDDDLPRLMCADWLREHGEDARADFIECQLEKAELERASGGKLPVRGIVFDQMTIIRRPQLDLDRMIPTVIDYEIEGVCEGVASITPGELIEAECKDLRRGVIRVMQALVDSVSFDVLRKRTVATLRSGNVAYEDSCPLRDRWRELVRLEKELHDANYSAHLQTLPLISHPTGFPDRIGIYSGGGYVQFVRGFVESIRIRGADWIDHADAILKRNPVRKVILTGVQQYGDGVFWHPPTQVAAFAPLSQWPGVEFTFEREGPNLYLGLASADEIDALPPGLYFGNESITVEPPRSRTNVRTQYD